MLAVPRLGSVALSLQKYGTEYVSESWYKVDERWYKATMRRSPNSAWCSLLRLVFSTRRTREALNLAAGGEVTFMHLLYISFAILHTEQTGGRERDFGARG